MDDFDCDHYRKLRRNDLINANAANAGDLQISCAVNHSYFLGTQTIPAVSRMTMAPPDADFRSNRVNLTDQREGITPQLPTHYRFPQGDNTNASCPPTPAAEFIRTAPLGNKVSLSPYLESTSIAFPPGIFNRNFAHCSGENTHTHTQNNSVVSLPLHINPTEIEQKIKLPSTNDSNGNTPYEILSPSLPPMPPFHKFSTLSVSPGLVSEKKPSAVTNTKLQNIATCGKDEFSEPLMSEEPRILKGDSSAEVNGSIIGLATLVKSPSDSDLCREQLKMRQSDTSNENFITQHFGLDAHSVNFTKEQTEIADMQDMINSLAIDQREKKGKMMSTDVSSSEYQNQVEPVDGFLNGINDSALTCHTKKESSEEGPTTTKRFNVQAMPMNTHHTFERGDKNASVEVQRSCIGEIIEKELQKKNSVSGMSKGTTSSHNPPKKRRVGTSQKALASPGRQGIDAKRSKTTPIRIHTRIPAHTLKENPKKSSAFPPTKIPNKESSVASPSNQQMLLSTSPGNIHVTLPPTPIGSYPHTTQVAKKLQGETMVDQSIFSHDETPLVKISDSTTSQIDPFKKEKVEPGKRLGRPRKRKLNSSLAKMRDSTTSQIDPFKNEKVEPGKRLGRQRKRKLNSTQEEPHEKSHLLGPDETPLGRQSATVPSTIDNSSSRKGNGKIVPREVVVRPKRRLNCSQKESHGRAAVETLIHKQSNPIASTPDEVPLGKQSDNLGCKKIKKVKTVVKKKLGRPKRFSQKEPNERALVGSLLNKQSDYNLATPNEDPLGKPSDVSDKKKNNGKIVSMKKTRRAKRKVNLSQMKPSGEAVVDTLLNMQSNSNGCTPNEALLAKQSANSEGKEMNEKTVLSKKLEIPKRMSNGAQMSSDDNNSPSKGKHKRPRREVTQYKRRERGSSQNLEKCKEIVKYKSEQFSESSCKIAPGSSVGILTNGNKKSQEIKRFAEENSDHELDNFSASEKNEDSGGKELVFKENLKAEERILRNATIPKGKGKAMMLSILQSQTSKPSSLIICSPSLLISSLVSLIPKQGREHNLMLQEEKEVLAAKETNDDNLFTSCYFDIKYNLRVMNHAIRTQIITGRDPAELFNGAIKIWTDDTAQAISDSKCNLDVRNAERLRYCVAGLWCVYAQALLCAAKQKKTTKRMGRPTKKSKKIILEEPRSVLKRATECPVAGGNVWPWIARSRLIEYEGFLQLSENLRTSKNPSLDPHRDLLNITLSKAKAICEEGLLLFGIFNSDETDISTGNGGKYIPDTTKCLVSRKGPVDSRGKNLLKKERNRLNSFLLLIHNSDKSVLESSTDARSCAADEISSASLSSQGFESQSQGHMSRFCALVSELTQDVGDSGKNMDESILSTRAQNIEKKSTMENMKNVGFQMKPPHRKTVNTVGSALCDDSKWICKQCHNFVNSFSDLQEHELRCTSEPNLKMDSPRHAVLTNLPGKSFQISDVIDVFDYLIEVHCATLKDVRLPDDSFDISSSPRFAGQVGIRCIFCRHLKRNSKVSCNILYPRSISHLVRAFSRMADIHFDTCSQVPVNVRVRYEQLRSIIQSKRKFQFYSYWRSIINDLNLTNEEWGVKMLRKESKPLAGLSFRTKTMHLRSIVSDSNKADLSDNMHLIFEQFSMCANHERFHKSPGEIFRANICDHAECGSFGFYGLVCRHCSFKEGKIHHVHVMPKCENEIETSVPSALVSHLKSCKYCPNNIKSKIQDFAKTSVWRGQRLSKGYSHTLLDELCFFEMPSRVQEIDKVQEIGRVQEINNSVEPKKKISSIVLSPSEKSHPVRRMTRSVSAKKRVNSSGTSKPIKSRNRKRFTSAYKAFGHLQSTTLPLASGKKVPPAKTSNKLILYSRPLASSSLIKSKNQKRIISSLKASGDVQSNAPSLNCGKIVSQMEPSNKNISYPQSLVSPSNMKYLSEYLYTILCQFTICGKNLKFHSTSNKSCLPICISEDCCQTDNTGWYGIVCRHCIVKGNKKDFHVTIKSPEELEDVFENVLFPHILKCPHCPDKTQRDIVQLRMCPKSRAYKERDMKEYLASLLNKLSVEDQHVGAINVPCEPAKPKTLANEITTLEVKAEKDISQSFHEFVSPTASSSTASLHGASSIRSNKEEKTPVKTQENSCVGPSLISLRPLVSKTDKILLTNTNHLIFEQFSLCASNVNFQINAPLDKNQLYVSACKNKDCLDDCSICGIVCRHCWSKGKSYDQFHLIDKRSCHHLADGLLAKLQGHLQECKSIPEDVKNKISSLSSRRRSPNSKKYFQFLYDEFRNVS